MSAWMWQTKPKLQSSANNKTYLLLSLTALPKAAAVQVFFFFFVASARQPDKKWIAVLSRPSKQASCLWRYRMVWYRMLFNPETTPWPRGRPIPHTAHPSWRAIEWTGYTASPRGERGEKQREDVEGVRGEQGVKFHPYMWVEVTTVPAYQIFPLYGVQFLTASFVSLRHVLTAKRGSWDPLGKPGAALGKSSV